MLTDRQLLVGYKRMNRSNTWVEIHKAAFQSQEDTLSSFHKDSQGLTYVYF